MNTVSPPTVGATAADNRIKLIIILGALSAFGPLSIDMYLPALPRLVTDFNATASEIQLTLSACLLGLALGQVIAGPISDARGRRGPLIVGVGIYALASLLCAVAPSLWTLILLRFVQGTAGAAGIVVARAIVRDMYSGIAVARFFSLLMLVNGIAPILAPIIGGQFMRFTSWRGIFVTLAVIGVLLLLSVIFGLRETLDPDTRQKGGVRTTLATFGRLSSDRHFMGYAVANALATAAMFSFISGSPFVLQNIYGVSPQTFSLFFGMNAFGMMMAGVVNGVLVGRFEPHRLLGFGLAASATGGLILLVVVVSGLVGLPGILLGLFVLIASLGFVFPNAATLALQGHPRTAGSASALLGVLRYLIGAAAAPLVGIAGEATALPMAILIAALGIASLAVFTILTRQEAAYDEAAPSPG